MHSCLTRPFAVTKRMARPCVAGGITARSVEVRLVETLRDRPRWGAEPGCGFESDAFKPGSAIPPRITKPGYEALGTSLDITMVGEAINGTTA
jgi:hypothetical protein